MHDVGVSENDEICGFAKPIGNGSELLEMSGVRGEAVDVVGAVEGGFEAACDEFGKEAESAAKRLGFHQPLPRISRPGQVAVLDPNPQAERLKCLRRTIGQLRAEPVAKERPERRVVIAQEHAHPSSALAMLDQRGQSGATSRISGPLAAGKPEVAEVAGDVNRVVRPDGIYPIGEPSRAIRPIESKVNVADEVESHGGSRG